MHLFTEYLVWFTVSIVLMSFVEHQVHQNILHKSRFSKYIRSLQKTFDSHAGLHHGHYASDFSDEPVGRGQDRGLRLNLTEGFFEILPAALIVAIFSLPGAITFQVVICLHHAFWNLIHVEMHKPDQRFFSEWPAYKYLARHHYLHHKYPGKNFNITIPLADYILGTNAHASETDLKAMRQLGLLGQGPILRSTAVAPVQSGTPVSSRSYRNR
jgi:hypothetical protein